MLQSATTDGPLFHSSRKLGRRRTMVSINKTQLMIGGGLSPRLVCFTARPVAAAVHIEGQVPAGGGPLANSTVTLWAASTADPRQLAQTTTSNDGLFQIASQEAIGAGVILYPIANGG